MKGNHVDRKTIKYVDISDVVSDIKKSIQILTAVQVVLTSRLSIQHANHVITFNCFRKRLIIWRCIIIVKTKTFVKTPNFSLSRSQKKTETQKSYENPRGYTKEDTCPYFGEQVSELIFHQQKISNDFGKRNCSMFEKFNIEYALTPARDSHAFFS